MCELGELGERVTGGLDCPDCGTADCDRKMFSKSEIKELKKINNKKMENVIIFE